MRPKFHVCGSLFLRASLTTSLAACGLGNQDPSFVENQRRISIALTVEDSGDSSNSEDAVSSDATARHLEGMGDAEVFDILNGAGGEQGDADATAPGASGDDDYDFYGPGDDRQDENGNPVDDDFDDDFDDDSSKNKGKNGDKGKKNKGGSKNPGPGGNDDAAGDDQSDQGSEVTTPSQAELQACAALNGVATERVKIAGNKPNATIQTSSVVAIKLAGNQGHLDLKLAGSGSVAGLCLFVTGNQGRANIESSVELGNFIYMGRGNRTAGDLNVLEEGSVANVVADLRGNQAALKVHGEGRFDCGKAKVNDKKGGFVCQ